jgi:hypothetical protein
MKTTQVKTEENLHFLQRVDRLQYSQGLKRLEACREIGISEGRLSEIRNGSVPVSEKMWSRLSAAEQRAGLTAEPHSQAIHCPAAPPANLDAMAQMQANMAELAASLAELTREVRSLRLEVSASSRTVAGGGIKLDVGRPTPTDPQQRAAS